MKATLKTLTIAAIYTSISACTAITDVTSSTSSTVDTVTPDVTLNNFIDKRYHAIRKDAAKGGGENIDALAQLAGTRDSEAFALWMQSNYDQIFTDGVKPSELAARIEQYKLANKG